MNEAAPKKFHLSTETVVATLVELFRAQGNGVACDVLENAKARIEETGYDNWDGGQYIFTLVLELPMKVFAHVESDVPKMEKLIAGKFPKVLPPAGNQWLQEVAIRPVLENPANSLSPKAAPVDVERLWSPGALRLFLSHVCKHKVAVSKLKWQLRKYGIAPFVAHEDIEPSQEWQSEIELALRSMHALVALLTPDFHQSKWTDQEVGVTVNNATSMSVALKNIAYRDIYRELEKARCFNFKMLDGALVTLRYRFRNGAVCEHVLCYFPSPDLDLFQNDPEIYLLDEIYADVIERNIVPFPVRFDFSDNAAKFVEVHHPYSHLTLGQYQNCRIPVCSPLSPFTFGSFILRNFYNTAFQKYSEELPATEVLFQNTITANERKIPHLVLGAAN